MEPHAEPNEDKLPPVATPEQAATFLQVSRKTVLRMLDDGRLTGRRTHPARGGRWRIRREVLVAFAGATA